MFLCIVKERLDTEMPIIACVVQSRKTHMVKRSKKNRRKLRKAGEAGSMTESLDQGDQLSKEQMKHLESVLQERNLVAIKLESLS